MTSLIFPAYNPGLSVERTWFSVRDFLRARPDPWEVLYVCDGCTDGTPERLTQLAEREDPKRFRILSYAPNRGKGYAVRYGMMAARGERRIFTDVDLAYRFDEIARVDNELRSGALMAIASREHPESTLELPPHFLGYAYRRRFQSGIFNKLARLLLPITARDTQAGLKGMLAPIAEKVIPPLTCDGFGFDCELLTACARYQVPVTEIPVCVRYEDAATTTGTGATIQMLRELWAISRRWPVQGFPGATTEETSKSTSAHAA